MMRDNKVTFADTLLLQIQCKIKYPDRLRVMETKQTEKELNSASKDNA